MTVQFPLGSDVVPAQADRRLRALIAEVRSGHWALRITGYASPESGTRKENDALSRDRARSLRTRLIQLGLPPDQISPGSVTGMGTAGIPPQACDRDGHLDQTICAQYRKAVIVTVKSH